MPSNPSIDTESNPYKAPIATLREVSDTRLPLVAVPHGQGVRFAVFSICAGFAAFLLWCVLDVITVRVLPYPVRVHDFDWFFILAIPFAILGSAFWCFRAVALGNRGWYVLGSTMIAIFLAFCLVICFGISFHFAIGGQL